jgi:hypothetical protein
MQMQIFRRQKTEHTKVLIIRGNFTMSYQGPGLTGDLQGKLLSQWQKFVAGQFNIGIEVAKAEYGGEPTDTWFFNAISEGIEEGNIADITWTAFPRELQVRFPDDGPERWGRADQNRSLQEEYCEWEVVKNGDELESVTFTTETPEYFRFLASEDRTLLLKLYEELVGKKVNIDDLILEGKYHETNKWNVSNGKGTIVHMGGNQANTLGAAINLSAQATWPSIDAHGNPITSEQALILCRRFGKAARHSDPHIGAQINALVRAGNRVSFPGPVGLYIDSIDKSGFEMPNGQSPDELFELERGTEDFQMRVTVRVPPGSQYKLADVLLDDEPLEYGGQIAEKIRIRIRGLAIPAPTPAPEIPCDNPHFSIAPLLHLTRSIIPTTE